MSLEDALKFFPNIFGKCILTRVCSFDLRNNILLISFSVFFFLVDQVGVALPPTGESTSLETEMSLRRGLTSDHKWSLGTH